MQISVPKLAIDKLIEIVRAGGSIRTGIDIFNKNGHLLLEKDVLVTDAKLLLNIKRLGVEWIPIISGNAGGLWDKDGKPIELPPTAIAPVQEPPPKPPRKISEIDRRIDEIIELKGIASQKYEHAKKCIKQTLASIQKNGGIFEFEPVVDAVSKLVDFVAINDNAFSYLTREIFSYDDYLYNHSINVCTIGTVVMRKFNENFSSVVNSFLNNASTSNLNNPKKHDEKSFAYFLPDELQDISIGFFLHDLGKVMIDKEIINKPGKLSEKEFEVVQSHSTEKGLEILKKNNLSNPYLINVSRYHHSRLFRNETRCYPADKNQTDIQPYVKVCKLADIYDAMTSKRCYKDAVNPVQVVTEIFRQYSEKDPLLQYILHSFVKSVGIYPSGSLVSLNNGQLAYVLDSQGPVLLPVTDACGEVLKTKQDIIVLGDGEDQTLQVDRRKPPISPVAAYKFLPDYLLKTIQPVPVMQ